MRSSTSRRDGSFATFTDQAGPALLRIAWFLTGDVDHAQELTQAGLVKTYLAWPKIDQDRARHATTGHTEDIWGVVALCGNRSQPLVGGSTRSGRPGCSPPRASR